MTGFGTSKAAEAAQPAAPQVGSARSVIVGELFLLLLPDASAAYDKLRAAFNRKEWQQKWSATRLQSVLNEALELPIAQPPKDRRKALSELTEPDCTYLRDLKPPVRAALDRLQFWELRREQRTSDAVDVGDHVFYKDEKVRGAVTELLEGCDGRKTLVGRTGAMASFDDRPAVAVFLWALQPAPRPECGSIPSMEGRF